MRMQYVSGSLSPPRIIRAWVRGYVLGMHTPIIIIITSECRALWGEPEQAIVDVGDDCLRVTNRYSGAGVPA